MATIDLGNVLKLFSGSKASTAARDELIKEVMLMTLARASSSDNNTQPVEVDTVQRVLEEATGETFSTADIRVAAASEIFERAPLEKYLASAASALTPRDRATIATSLARVIQSDVKVTDQEIAFFDRVVAALGVTPAELAGLVK